MDSTREATAATHPKLTRGFDHERVGEAGAAHPPAGPVAGLNDFERELLGDGRTPRLAGRALRVLEELGLVAVDRAARSLTVPAARRTALERSPAFRAHAALLEEGRRRLRGPRGRPAAPAA